MPFRYIVALSLLDTLAMTDTKATAMTPCKALTMIPMKAMTAISAGWVSKGLRLTHGDGPAGQAKQSDHQDQKQ